MDVVTARRDERDDQDHPPHQYLTQISSPAARSPRAVTPAVVVINAAVALFVLNAAVPFHTICASPKNVPSLAAGTVTPTGSVNRFQPVALSRCGTMVRT